MTRHACPDCGFRGTNVGMHRARAHDWTPPATGPDIGPRPGWSDAWDPPDGKGHDPDPRWRADAACRGTDPALWYPTREEAAGATGGRRGHRLPGIAICQTCPVQTDCLTYALDHGETHGIWGGTTPKERLALRRERRTA